MACKEVDGLFILNKGHCSDEWRLFIDSTKVSLKAVRLYNGNVLPSIPVAQIFGIKESDDSMKQLLQYKEYDIQVEHLCGPESHCTFAWTAARVHKISLFLVRVGQQGQGASL